VNVSSGTGLPGLSRTNGRWLVEGLGERCKLLQRGLGRSPSRNRIWSTLALKYDISGGNNPNDLPETVQSRKILTGKITAKIEKIFFSFSRPWPWAYVLNGPNAAASTAPTLIRHWALLSAAVRETVTPLLQL